MNKLFDLRFVIGSFFTIIGILLLLYGFLTGSKDDQSINRWCGAVFLIFGVVMIILSFQKDAHDELLEENRD